MSDSVYRHLTCLKSKDGTSPSLNEMFFLQVRVFVVEVLQACFFVCLFFAKLKC